VADLLTDLRAYLIAQGVVRKPSTAGSLPPMFLEPQLGVPAPGEGQGNEVGDPVLGAFATGGFVLGPYMDSFARQPTIQINYRGKDPQAIQALELQITKRLVDRRDWMMSSTYLVESGLWQALQRLGSDTQGWEYTSAYMFQLYR
jgi:hypothetical protein